MSKASKKHNTQKLQEKFKFTETMLQLSVRTANTAVVPMDKRLYWAKIPVVIAGEPKVSVCVSMCICAHEGMHVCVHVCPCDKSYLNSVTLNVVSPIHF